MRTKSGHEDGHKQHTNNQCWTWVGGSQGKAEKGTLMSCHAQPTVIEILVPFFRRGYAGHPRICSRDYGMTDIRKKAKGHSWYIILKTLTVGKTMLATIGLVRGVVAPQILNIVMLCFEKHFSKQKCYSPKIKHFPPQNFWAGYATASNT